LHTQRSCWEKGLKGALANALKMEFTEQDREYLRMYMAGLPDEPTQDQETSTGLEREKAGRQ
jgi:hypothetical protein